MAECQNDRSQLKGAPNGQSWGNFSNKINHGDNGL